MNTDPIADMLTRIRNAERAGHNSVRMPYSKIKQSILEVLKAHHFIEKIEINSSNSFKEIEVSLSPRTHKLDLKRVSKPGQRIYVKANEIPSVLNGLGISILSTPKGVLSNREAKKHNVGGELLCTIY